eukprot:COSAG01_NODE_145_length_24103_cov_41.178012_22_plen_68_part_00
MAERKRDASEQRRCDALLEQGRIQTELDNASLAVVRLVLACCCQLNSPCIVVIIACVCACAPACLEY